MSRMGRFMTPYERYAPKALGATPQWLTPTGSQKVNRKRLALWVCGSCEISHPCFRQEYVKGSTVSYPDNLHRQSSWDGSVGALVVRSGAVRPTTMVGCISR